MELVGFSSDEPTVLELPFVRPHPAAWNERSGQTAAAHNCIEEQTPPHSTQYARLTSISIRQPSLRSFQFQCHRFRTWQTHWWEFPIGCAILVSTNQNSRATLLCSLISQRGRQWPHACAASANTSAYYHIQSFVTTYGKLTDWSNTSARSIRASPYRTVLTFGVSARYGVPKQDFEHAGLRIGLPAETLFIHLTIDEKLGATSALFSSSWLDRQCKRNFTLLQTARDSLESFLTIT